MGSQSEQPVDITAADVEVTTVPSLPALTQFKFGLIAFILQTFVVQPANLLRTWWQSMAPTCHGADLVKTYPCRKHLQVRIFFPKSFNRSSNQKIPLLFNCHGGGFVVGHPIDTEMWNRSFADKHGMVIVALNYGKAPANPFPKPIYDVEALIVSALSDTKDLFMIDHSRVALLGWSAGGTIATAVAQLDSIRPRLRAIVPMYPALHFTVAGTTKVARTRKKADLGGFRGMGKDFIVPMAGVFNWAYQPPGHDLRDPLLCPGWAEKEKLPSHIFILAAELDLLAHEAWKMACKLGGRRIPCKNEREGWK